MRHPVFAMLGRNAGKIMVVALLALPGLISVYDAVTKPADPNPNRKQLPPRPASIAELLDTPPLLEAWINDHFGYRLPLLQYNNRLRFKLFREFPTVQMAAGRHGRYFLSAHNTSMRPYQALTTICSRARADDANVAHLNRLFRAFRGAGLDPKLLVVPSAPQVYPEDVPRFLERECASAVNPIDAMLASGRLERTAAAAIFYPLSEMREIKKSALLFPKTWFHWTGDGLDQVARLSLTHFWQRPLDQAPALAQNKRIQRADVSHLFDGVLLESETIEPDLDKSGVKGCWGGACYPEIADITEILGDVSRFDNPRAPRRRLLIISDSFGSKVSAWYARYYARVEQFATNEVGRLTPAQLAAFKAYLYRERADTDILFLYHDGGALNNVLRFGTEPLLPAPLPQA
ncbi:hypothetical protein F2P45_10090 [Massilia sp. CCM 8733]|uniref:AlgX/AlgJ SGNH hydrolase-like domain-containing protein n=1 Tax=Massilia mucilaginosa TaxID=2609282 RepID=A0ABX0NR56_9BURK|nr:hypothetical protein [Massilia mucilaginosa]NHZ89361.1 hypothetical protein [Massilia mucilaginosa]